MCSLQVILLIMKISNFIVNEQIQEKLETNNFLKFYRLIVRIPKAFKDCLKENLLDLHFDAHDTTDTFVKKKIVSNKKAKFIYRNLIDKIVQNPT